MRTVTARSTNENRENNQRRTEKTHNNSTHNEKTPDENTHNKNIKNTDFGHEFRSIAESVLKFVEIGMGAKLKETSRSMRTLETLTGLTILDKDSGNSKSKENT